MKLAYGTGSDFIEVFPLTSGGFGIVFYPGFRCDELGDAFRGALVALLSSVMQACVFCMAYPLQVLNSVIGFVAVFVMNVKRPIGLLKPTQGDDSVKKCLSAHLVVPIGSARRMIGLELSENLSAGRNSVEVIESAVFHPVYNEANHVGTPSGCWSFHTSRF